MDRQFYAMLSRMKYINRWALMRNTREENICEHSHEVAVLAHALALLHNRRFGGHADPGRCVLLALYHDAPEILTGDLPTPVKYYNAETKKAYDIVEEAAKARFAQSLPAELRDGYADIFRYTEDEKRLIKAADKLAALLKCKTELDSGNREFAPAMASVEATLKGMGMEEVGYFLDRFYAAFSLPLDLI